MSSKQSNPIYVFISALREVFKKFRFVALAIISAVVIGVGIIWLSSHQLIRFTLTSDIFSWSAKLKILWTSLGMYATNFTLASQIMIVLVALLSGINIAMLVFYFKRRMAVSGAAGASGFGLVVGTLGVGCSACGSVILSSLIGITSASVLVSALPLRGAEFGIMSIALIGLSTYWIAKKIQSPETCAIKTHAHTL